MIIRHIVLLTWNDGVAPEQLREFTAALDVLGAAPGLCRSLSYGPDLQLGPRRHDFALVFDFDDEEGFHRFDKAPEHDALRALLPSLVASASAVDYHVND